VREVRGVVLDGPFSVWCSDGAPFGCGCAEGESLGPIPSSQDHQGHHGSLEPRIGGGER
jgi:hypothetical protein